MLTVMLLKSCLLVLSFGAIAKGTPRVVGGNDAPNHKYPYQVSLRDSEKGHFCSASILNKRWLLSAAHCFERRDIKTFNVSVGTNFLNETGTVYLPEFYIVHEKYESFYYYDIAMIRLKSDIIFTDFVKKIALPDQDLQDYSRPAAFAGWGRTESGGSLPNVLQEIELRVITNRECELTRRDINDAHICTLTMFGEGICQGDSGGPLVVDGVQVGIVSYVVPCALNIPDVYTRVWSYRNWIDVNLEQYINVEE